MLERFVLPLRERHCASVVAILRGGLFPGHFLANELGLPIQFIDFDRKAGAVSMLGSVPAGRVLLVDDSCVSGRTIAPCREWLEAHGCEVITCAIFAVRPVKLDFAIEAEPAPSQEWVVPWERRLFTPNGKASSVKDKYPGRDDWHLAFRAWDLDGIFVRDLGRDRYRIDLEHALAQRDSLAPLPNTPEIDYPNAVIITARPMSDADRTRRWWARHFPQLPIYFRDECRYGNSPQEVARYKAETALAVGATHFTESDLSIATMISVRAPMLHVAWLDPSTGDTLAISAWKQTQRSGCRQAGNGHL
jgi:adenine/guanine phosphoribosyltransferase-like PRPP-binding protein